MGSMDGNVCLVTGATSGLGTETARALAGEGATVIVHGRDRARVESVVRTLAESTGNGDLHPLLADLSSLAQVRAAAAQVDASFDRLDVLVNNAGGIFGRRTVTEDGMELTFQVDYLSHFLLTGLLFPKIRASAPSRIINVSSGAHTRGSIRFQDLQMVRRYGAWRAYSQAKLAQVMFTYELARRLEGTAVTVNALHPGWVSSNFGSGAGPLIRYGAKLSYLFGRSPRKGADTAIYLATSPEVEDVTGKYFVDRKAVRSSRTSYDADAQRRLWTVSEELCGLTAPKGPA
jgi:retinol dehydrogenase-14